MSYAPFHISETSAKPTPRAPAFASSTYFTNRSRSARPTLSCQPFQAANASAGLRVFCSTFESWSMSLHCSLAPTFVQTLPLP
jgi:hypothetical protein